MKKLIVLAIIMAVMVLVAALVHAQSSRKRPEAHVHQSDARPLRQRVARLHRVLPQGVGGGASRRARSCF